MKTAVEIPGLALIILIAASAEVPKVGNDVELRTWPLGRPATTSILRLCSKLVSVNAPAVSHMFVQRLQGAGNQRQNGESRR